MRSPVAAIAYGRADTLAPSTAASPAPAATLRGLSGRTFGTEVHGLWTMPFPWNSTNSAGSHRDLEKSPHHRGDLSTFPTGPTGFSFTDVKTTKPGSETILKHLIFSLDDGVHLNSSFQFRLHNALPIYP